MSDFDYDTDDDREMSTDAAGKTVNIVKYLPGTAGEVYDTEQDAMAKELCEEGLWIAMAMISDFHKKVVGCKDPAPFKKIEASMNSDALKVHAEWFLEEFKKTDNTAYLRLHLITEELSELVAALSEGNEVDAFDALIDLLYVVLGSGVSMNFPLDEGFLEVHRSNMTKKRKATDPDGVRVRDKGEAYDPPKLKELLDEYRKRRSDASTRHV
jgi:predicted HAD superfamily Cof-like phosphohydrolase